MIAGKVIVTRLIDIFKEYGLSEGEIKRHVIFLSDRGPNVRYGLTKAGFIRLTCYAHMIHNLVSYMLDEKSVQVLIKQSTCLSSYVKNSGLNKELKMGLKLYTKTRWNSVYSMVDVIINNYQDLYELLISRQRLRNEARISCNQQPDNVISDLVTNINLTELTRLRDFLAPFKVRILFSL